MAKTTSNPSQVHKILDDLSEAGFLQHSRPSWSLFLSALAAGLEIGFSILLMGVLFSLFKNRISQPSLHILLSLSYSLFFLFVIIGQEELFSDGACMPSTSTQNPSLTCMAVTARGVDCALSQLKKGPI